MRASFNIRVGYGRIIQHVCSGMYVVSAAPCLFSRRSGEALMIFTATAPLRNLLEEVDGDVSWARVSLPAAVREGDFARIRRLRQVFQLSGERPPDADPRVEQPAFYAASHRNQSLVAQKSFWQSSPDRGFHRINYRSRCISVPRLNFSKRTALHVRARGPTILKQVAYFETVNVPILGTSDTKTDMWPRCICFRDVRGG